MRQIDPKGCFLIYLYIYVHAYIYCDQKTTGLTPIRAKYATEIICTIRKRPKHSGYSDKLHAGMKIDVFALRAKKHPKHTAFKNP